MPQLRHKIQAKRGASMSVALLLMLVCVAISSIVLAAATASAGRIAEAGKSDQRYYSVTSAVRMFEASLANGGNSYSSTQRRNSNDQVEITFSAPDPAATKGYDFLTPITCFALFGSPTFDGASKASAESTLKSSGSWIEPFSSQELQMSMGSENYFTSRYTVALPSISGVDTENTNLKVAVEARLHDDWTLELVFSNTGVGTNDRYRIYMLLQADVSKEEHESTYGDPKWWDRDTNVLWECVSIQQGRGFPNA